MQFRVTANNTNGSLPRLEELFDTIEQAKKHADWWHLQSSVCNVEIDEPLGVMLTRANGEKVFGTAASLHEAMEARASWQAVIANKKTNKSRVKRAEIVGLPVKTAIATPEDHYVGTWMAEALEDPKMPPSMKYDINRWMDSKEWV
jgi:hypothetical protein